MDGTHARLRHINYPKITTRWTRPTTSSARRPSRPSWTTGRRRTSSRTLTVPSRRTQSQSRRQSRMLSWGIRSKTHAVRRRSERPCSPPARENGPSRAHPSASGASCAPVLRPRVSRGCADFRGSKRLNRSDLCPIRKGAPTVAGGSHQSGHVARLGNPLREKRCAHFLLPCIFLHLKICVSCQ